MFIKIFKPFFCILFVGLLACNTKQNVNEEKEISELNIENDSISYEKFKNKVIEKAKTKEKLFLDFWTGMTKEEYNIIEKNLIEKSILEDDSERVEIRDYNGIFIRDSINKKIMFNFYIDNANSPDYAYVHPKFINDTLIGITLRFKHSELAERKTVSIDKDKLISLYKEKYGDYIYLKEEGEFFNGFYKHENFLFKDKEGKKYIDIGISTVKEEVSKLGISPSIIKLDKYKGKYKECLISYVSFANYNKFSRNFFSTYYETIKQAQEDKKVLEEFKELI